MLELVAGTARHYASDLGAGPIDRGDETGKLISSRARMRSSTVNRWSATYSTSTAVGASVPTPLGWTGGCRPADAMRVGSVRWQDEPANYAPERHLSQCNPAMARMLLPKLSKPIVAGAATQLDCADFETTRRARN